MRIGELATRTGVPTRMLRYYEEQGLITPRRLANGYREYDDFLADTGAPVPAPRLHELIEASTRPAVAEREF